MKYVDLVICRTGGLRRLYQAPAFSNLKEKDEVMVEACDGEMMVEVIRTITVNAEDEVFDFIVNATGARLPLNKVLKRLVYDELVFKEETDE